MVGDIGSIELDREGGPECRSEKQNKVTPALSAVQSAQLKLRTLGCVPGHQQRQGGLLCAVYGENTGWPRAVMLALTGSRVGSWGSKMVEVAAAGVVATAAAGGIFVCSVSVASCGNMAAHREPSAGQR